MPTTLGLGSSDAGKNLNSSNAIARTTKNLSQAQKVSTNGVKGDTYCANYEVAQDSQIRKVDNTSLNKQNDTLNTLTADLHNVESSYKKFETIMADYNARAKNYISSGRGDSGFQDFCKQSLKTVENCLNEQSIQGYYLFGGVGGDKPVKESLETLVVPPVGISLMATDYSNYQNVPAFKTVNINGLKFDVNSRYDSPEINNMIHALVIGANTLPSTDVDSDNYKQIQNGMILSVQSSDGIGAKFGRLGTQTQKMEVTKESNLDKINENLLIIKDYDTVEALEALNIFFELSNQLQLQSSMSSHMNKMVMDSINSLMRF